MDKTKLNSMYRSAESADNSLFSEMKSNVRLVAGDHYLKSSQKDLQRSKYAKRLSSEVRLRLVQNHISKFSNVWVNAIAGDITSVQVVPNNESELRDKKAAELFASVQAYLAEQSDFDSKIRALAKDYVDIGEAIVKIYFDPAAGPLTDGPIVEQLNPLTGEVEVVQQQIPAGAIKFERILPFDLLRDPGAKDWDEARWVIYRKMMDKATLLARVEDPDKRRAISESNGGTYQVYNGNSNNYNESKKVLIKEFYFKPSVDMPNGYYVIMTEETILFEGELPGGLFPIEIVNFDDIPTTPRGRSKIKQLRPIQAEINRAVSKMAEHQMTLGDDKLIIPAGTKIQESNRIAGIRAIQIGGLEPTILPGRAGDQYLGYWEKQVELFYLIAEIPEVNEDKIKDMDPMSMMYRSMKDKKKFSFYAEKFEKFLVRIWRKALALYKFSVDPIAAIPAVGKDEKINLDELKSTDDIRTQIKIKKIDNDPESMIGKHMALTQLLQYAGDKLTDADVGEIVANMPFLDKNILVTEAKLKYDRAVNLLLKLDRGVPIQISEFDDPEYMIKRIDNRMAQPDFDFITAKGPNGEVLPTEYIQDLYRQVREQYIQLQTENMKAQQAREAGMIPTTGAPIKVQMQTTELKSDGSGYKSVRLEFPHDSLQWLKDMLIKQGMTEQTLKGFMPETQARLSAGLATPEDMVAAQAAQDLMTDEQQRQNDQMGQPPQIIR